MKNKLVTLLSLATISMAAQNRYEKDVASIKSMSGCYKVSFNFAETFPNSKDYEKHKDYHSGALEWVEVAEEKPGKIVLQHILVVNPKGEGKDAIVKHWRQDWLYQNTNFYLFDKGTHWKYKSVAPGTVKNQWTQVVYQVDDSPRYAASGTWVHIDGKDYWEGNADSPLPRRDYTKRSDYNVMNRSNRHEIFDWGWLHFQDNKKILRKDSAKDSVLVEEIGKEYYVRTSPEKCLKAQNYWKEYAPLWKTIRSTWDERMKQKRDLSIQPNLEDTHLYMQLMGLSPTEHRKAAKLVNDYIKE